jgi:hypothetical protein
MLPNRGLLRDVTGRWFHISRRQTTVVMRPLDASGPDVRFTSPGTTELERMVEGGEIYSLGRIVTELAGIIVFPPRGFKSTELERWREVTAALGEVKTSPRQPAPSSLLVPISRLRRFYETLRLVNTVPVHEAIAEHLARDPERADILDTLFAESIRHLVSTPVSDVPLSPIEMSHFG